MSADSPRHSRVGGPLTVAPQPPSERNLIDTVSGFISDVTTANNTAADPKDSIQWARFECADINEPTPEGDGETELSPLLLVLGYGSGVQVWLIPPNGEAQEVLSWRQGTVRVLRILPTPIHSDNFATRRPLLALCDSSGPGPAFCSLSFISVRGGDQAKSIKFKNPILDVLANKRSVVVSFAERFAVFDACTLEDRLSVTTCYPCPCPLGGASPLNPLALGDRWLAYADKKLSSAKRSSGGCEGEGVSSYTASVLHAAKSLSAGLRGLGESVASSLAGGRGGRGAGALSQSPSPPNTHHHQHQQPGVVTVMDIESLSEEELQDSCDEPIVAHFLAHSEAIIALKFDASGMLLVTADKRGHDFHVFRLQPHPGGPALASVHHLYVLHRGDTTSKVQDIALSLDSRWVAVSTLRGTTHVFPLSTYGGACGVRTHTQPRVVNRLSRFHRSAGLAIDGRSSSPVGDSSPQGAWFPNPRLPPFPAPTTLHPLAQLRPSPGLTSAVLPTHTITRNSSGRQRLSSLSEEGQPPLCVCAWWARGGARSPSAPSRAPSTSPAPHSLYVMSASGQLVQYGIYPKPVSGIPKEKVCDDTPIELEVEARLQWGLARPANARDLPAPLPHNSPLLAAHTRKNAVECSSSSEDGWLSQVEIITHAGPHRRLWMGPQFVFKTYNTNMGSALSLLDEAVEIGTSPPVARSNPVNMPGARPILPVLIDSGSASSLEPSPSDGFRRKVWESRGNTDRNQSQSQVCDVQLREDLAEAMKDTEHSQHSQHLQHLHHGVPREQSDVRGSHVHRLVNPLGTVVAGSSPSPPPVPDLHALHNHDEALFRPVQDAPQSLPAEHAIHASSLSSCTFVPVTQLQRTSHRYQEPNQDLRPLTSQFIIPAVLTAKLDSDDCHKLFQCEMENAEEPAAAVDIGQHYQVDKKENCNNMNRKTRNGKLTVQNVERTKTEYNIEENIVSKSKIQDNSKEERRFGYNPEMKGYGVTDEIQKNIENRMDEREENEKTASTEVEESTEGNTSSKNNRSNDKKEKRERKNKFRQDATLDVPAKNVTKEKTYISQVPEMVFTAILSKEASPERDAKVVTKRSLPDDKKTSRKRDVKTPVRDETSPSDVTANSGKEVNFECDARVDKSKVPSDDQKTIKKKDVITPGRDDSSPENKSYPVVMEEMLDTDIKNQAHKKETECIESIVENKEMSETISKPDEINKITKNVRSQVETELKIQEVSRISKDSSDFHDMSDRNIRTKKRDSKPLESTPTMPDEKCLTAIDEDLSATLVVALPTPQQSKTNTKNCEKLNKSVEESIDMNLNVDISLNTEIVVLDENTDAKLYTTGTVDTKRADESKFKSKKGKKNKAKTADNTRENAAVGGTPHPEVKETISIKKINSATNKESLTNIWDKSPKTSVATCEPYSQRESKDSWPPLKLGTQGSVESIPKSWSSIVSAPAHISSGVNADSHANTRESMRESLPEKLATIYNRKDIVVAECDAPLELDFVEEHHSFILDLPPLEPLSFLKEMKGSIFSVKSTSDEITSVPKNEQADVMFDECSDDMFSDLTKELASLESAEESIFDTFDDVHVTNCDVINDLDEDAGLEIVSEYYVSKKFVIDNSEEISSGCVPGMMEKSVEDDKDPSPLSSQTESDEKDTRREDSLLAAPGPNSKPTNKKSKRKRR